jgi:glycerol-3-phosphate acyltransferase PlsY
VGVARAVGADRRGQALAGFTAMVGHAWPAFAGFRGGKSVATGFGALLSVTRWGSAGAIGIGMSTLLSTRVVSLGSLSAAGGAVLGAGVEARRTGDRTALVFATLAASLILARHSPNLRRLVRGEEPQVSLRRRRGTTSS